MGTIAKYRKAHLWENLLQLLHSKLCEKNCLISLLFSFFKRHHRPSLCSSLLLRAPTEVPSMHATGQIPQGPSRVTIVMIAASSTSAHQLPAHSAAILASMSFTDGGSLYTRNPAYIVKSFPCLLRSSIIRRLVPSLELYCALTILRRCCSQLFPAHSMRSGTMRLIVFGSAACLAAY